MTRFASREAYITKNDRREIGKLMRFLRKVNEGTPQFHAYGEIYGEVVYEAKKDEPSSPSGSKEQ